MTTLHRAYSVLNVKEMKEDNDAYYIEGVATTPKPDRYGDIVNPLGAKFALPMPLLWQHDARLPVGQLTFAKPQKNGIPFKGMLPKVKEAGNLRDRIEEAAQSIKYRLVTAVSIGFQALKDGYEMMESGGILFKEWEWLELSLVTIPANSDATLRNIKALVREQLAATGRELPRTVYLKSAGATAISNRTSEEDTAMNIQENIKSFEAKRAALAASLASIMEKSATEGRTLDAEEKDQYDEAETELKAVDEHLDRLRKLDKIDPSFRN